MALDGVGIGTLLASSGPAVRLTRGAPSGVLAVSGQSRSANKLRSLPFVFQRVLRKQAIGLIVVHDQDSGFFGFVVSHRSSGAGPPWGSRLPRDIEPR